MNSCKAIIGPARRLIVVVILTSSAPAAFAQTPQASNRDDLDVTMGVIANPDATEADEIVRRIPRSRPHRPGEGDDSQAKDLADPNRTGRQDETGTPIDPGIPIAPAPIDPVTPADPGTTAQPVIPVVPAPAPDPGGSA